MLLLCSRRGSRLVLSTGRARSGLRGRNAPLCHDVRLGTCRTDETQDLAGFYNQGTDTIWLSELHPPESLSIRFGFKGQFESAHYDADVWLGCGEATFYSSICKGYVVIGLTLNKFRPVCATGIRYWEWGVYIAAARYVPIQSVPSPLTHPYTRSALALGSNELTFNIFLVSNRTFYLFTFLIDCALHSGGSVELLCLFCTHGVVL